MKDRLRWDSWVTIGGLSLLVAIFFLAVFMPERKKAARVRREIAETEQAIRDIPVRLAELESLDEQIARGNEYLKKTAPLVPLETDLHAVLREVSKLAEASNLSVTRLEPLVPAPYASFRAIPFRISFRGKFRQIAAFVRGLETRSRLFTIEELTLKCETPGSGTDAQGDIRFSVYARNRDPADSIENNASPGRHIADRGRR